MFCEVRAGRAERLARELIEYPGARALRKPLFEAVLADETSALDMGLVHV